MKPISKITESGPVSAQTNLSVGDRVVTPTNSQGVITQPKFTLPFHHLVQLDNGTIFWMLKEILQPAPAMPTKKRRKPA